MKLLRIPNDVRGVLAKLRRFRGEFVIGDEGEIRHRSVCTPVFPTIPACPLAFLCIEDGDAETEYVANTSVNDFANCLNLSIDSAINFMRAADADKEVPAHSRRLVAVIRKAIIQACINRRVS
jgi:hypothetical protein